MKRRTALAAAALGAAGAPAAWVAAANALTGEPAPAPLLPHEGKHMHILILGASGMVGGEALRASLAHENVSHVTALVRRPLAVDHPKLTQLVHADFSDLSALHLGGFDACLYCIGAYTGTLDDAAYERVMLTIPCAFGDALRQQNAGVTMCLLTGGGADETEQSRTAYARFFGKTENHFRRLGFKRLHIFRPGYIYPTTPRKEPTFAYRLLRVLYRPLLAHLPGSTTSLQLARVMLDVALSDGGKEVYENADIAGYFRT